MLETTDRTRASRSPVLLRWLSLTEIHGSQSAALEALIRAYDELQRLQRAVRGLGLSPEILGSEAHSKSLVGTNCQKVSP